MKYMILFFLLFTGCAINTDSSTNVDMENPQVETTACLTGKAINCVSLKHDVTNKINSKYSRLIFPNVARIMPLGDSITLGVNGGYRDGLYTRLTQAGYHIDFVGSETDILTDVLDKDHEGHPGYTIASIDSFIVDWLGNSNPTHILLMIGTNDVAWWCEKTGSQVAEDNVALIRKIFTIKPYVTIIVGSSPPLSSVSVEPNNIDRVILLNDYLTALKNRVNDLQLEGLRVKFADVNGSLTVNDLYDGVHPTEAAAEKMAEVWFQALKPTL